MSQGIAQINIIPPDEPPARQYDIETKASQLDEGPTPENAAVWMLDTDYNGRSVYPRQVYFPMAGKDGGWAKLAKSLKAELDEDLIEVYRGTVSLPFQPGPNQTIAVKIIDDRGIESLRVMEVDIRNV